MKQVNTRNASIFLNHSSPSFNQLNWQISEVVKLKIDFRHLPSTTHSFPSLFLICFTCISFLANVGNEAYISVYSLYSYGDLLSSSVLFSILPLLVCFPCDHYSTCSLSYPVNWGPSSIVPTHPIPVLGVDLASPRLSGSGTVPHGAGLGDQINLSLTYATEVRTRQL